MTRRKMMFAVAATWKIYHCRIRFAMSGLPPKAEAHV